MKKLILILVFIVSVVGSSCTSGINSGVKVITKCCALSAQGAKARCNFINNVESKALESNNSSELLPIYTWDAKQMLW